MISNVQLLNVNQANQNNRKAQNVSFSSVHALKIPAKYGIKTEDDFMRILSGEPHHEFHNICKKFNEFVKKITSPEDLKIQPTRGATYNIDNEGVYAYFTGADSAAIAKTKLQETAVNLIKEKGAMYQVNPDNSINIIG